MKLTAGTVGELIGLTLNNKLAIGSEFYLTTQKYVMLCGISVNAIIKIYASRIEYEPGKGFSEITLYIGYVNSNKISNIIAKYNGELLFEIYKDSEKIYLKSLSSYIKIRVQVSALGSGTVEPEIIAIEPSPIYKIEYT